LTNNSQKRKSKFAKRGSYSKNHNFDKNFMKQFKMKNKIKNKRRNSTLNFEEINEHTNSGLNNNNTPTSEITLKDDVIDKLLNLLMM
jgi:hypothetical protein